MMLRQMPRYQAYMREKEWHRKLPVRTLYRGENPRSRSRQASRYAAGFFRNILDRITDLCYTVICSLPETAGAVRLNLPAEVSGFLITDDQTSSFSPEGLFSCRTLPAK